jgi:hypothetical protein
MTTRSRRETLTFRQPFRIKGIDRLLAAGDYEVGTDEEMIEGLSFPCFRRVATMIMVPGAAPHASSTEMISISSVDLSDAQRDDATASSEWQPGRSRHPRRGMAAQPVSDDCGGMTIAVPVPMRTDVPVTA